VADRSGATFHVDPAVGPLAGQHGKSPITTHPPPPHAPSYPPMFATEKRSPVKFIAMLVGGATIAIGGGALAAWLFLGGDDEEPKPEKEPVVAKGDKDEPTKKDPEEVEDPPPEKTDGGLEIKEEPEVKEEPEIKEEPEPEVKEEPEVEPEIKEQPQHETKTVKSGQNRKNQHREQKIKEKLEPGDVSRGFGKAQGVASGCKGIVPGMRITVQADIRGDGTVLAAKALNNQGLDATKCVVSAVRSRARFAQTTRALDSKTWTYKF
jgi:hypothetical protein